MFRHELLYHFGEGKKPLFSWYFWACCWFIYHVATVAFTFLVKSGGAYEKDNSLWNINIVICMSVINDSMTMFAVLFYFSDGARTGSAHRGRLVPGQLPRLNADRLRRTAHQIHSHDAGGRGRLSNQGKVPSQDILSPVSTLSPSHFSTDDESNPDLPY